MRYAELKNNILTARDLRWETMRMLAEMYPDGHIITVSANIAGENKDDHRARLLIDWAEHRMRSLTRALTTGAYGDAAGYIIFMHSSEDSVKIKQAAVSIENEADSCRLLDIDVYDAGLRAISRTTLGFEPRKCLLCGENAADCMRTHKHDYSEIIAGTDMLLDKFVSTEQGTL